MRKLARSLMMAGALMLPAASIGQEKSYRTEYRFVDNFMTIGYTDQFNCDLPLYFPLEKNLEFRYVGRVFKHRGGVVIQISDAGSTKKKDEFMTLEHEKQNQLFDALTPMEEYSTSLPPHYGQSYNDEFKTFQNGEWSHTKGEKLNGATVQSGKDAVPVLKYFSGLFKNQILPWLEQCKQPGSQ